MSKLEAVVFQHVGELAMLTGSSAGHGDKVTVLAGVVSLRN